MNKFVFSLVLFVLSVIMYLYADRQYDYLFCLTCTGVFLTNSFVIVRNDLKEIGLLNFNLLFSLSFFLCSYVFAVILYPSDILSPLFIYYVSLPEHVINKCTALCTCAYAIYSCGYFYSYRQKKIKYNSLEIKHGLCNKSYKIYLITFAALTINALIYMRTHADSIQVETAPFLTVLFIVSLSILLYIILIDNRGRSLKHILRNNMFLVVSIFVVVAIYTLIGDRALIVQVGLAIICAYSLLVKRINFLTLIGLFIIGVVFMYSIRLTRNTGYKISNSGISSVAQITSSTMNEDNTILAPFSDLTERYEELYLGYDYVQNKGEYYYPLKIIVLLFSPIPLLPSTASSLIYGVPTNVLSIGYAIGKNWDTSSGNHCVIDCYASWGGIGLLLVFFVFGRIVNIVTNKFRIDYRYGVCYIILLSQAIFIPRASLFDVYRPLFWGLIILYFLNKSKKYVKN